MKIPFYQVDAFTSKVLAGNPAGVCVLDEWLSDAMMQAIAAENNVSETAFLVRRGDVFELTWFTPVTASTHCVLIPYWARALGKKTLYALQEPKRGGELFCRNRGERVRIAGTSALYLEGTVSV